MKTIKVDTLVQAYSLLLVLYMAFYLWYEFYLGYIRSPKYKEDVAYYMSCGVFAGIAILLSMVSLLY